MVRWGSKVLTTGGLRDLVGLRAAFSPPVERYALAGLGEVILFILKGDFVGVFVTSAVSDALALVGVSFLSGSVSMSGSASKHALKL